MDKEEKIALRLIVIRKEIIEALKALGGVKKKLQRLL